jgi:hypothetical protein
VIPAVKPLIGDEGRLAVNRVLRGMIAGGPEVAAFERDFGELVVAGRHGVSGSGSGRRVLRVDAVLAEQGVQPLDLVGEPLDPFGQIRQRRVRGGPLLLLRGPASQQFVLLVPQHRGLLIPLSTGGAAPLEASPVDLLVQVAGVRPPAYPLLDGGQPGLGLVQASLRAPAASRRQC